MLNIWQNTFYYTPPALAWMYKGVFNDFCDWDSLKENKEGYKTLNNAIVSLTIPDRETQVESIFYGGMEFPQYTRANNAGSFTIKFNENSLYEVSHILEELYNKFSYNANLYPKSSGNSSESSGYEYRMPNNTDKEKIRIDIFKYAGLNNSNTNNCKESDFCKSILFEGCKIIKLDGFELSYESEESITRSVSFSFNHMKISKHING